MQFTSRIGRVVGLLFHPVATQAGIHLSAGVLAVGWLTVAQAALGASPVSHLALVAVLAVTLIANSRPVGERTLSFAPIALGLLGLSLPWMPQVGQAVTGCFLTVGEMPSIGRQFVAQFAALAVLLGLPTSLVTRLWLRAGASTVVAAASRRRDEAGRLIYESPSSLCLASKLALFALGMLINVTLGSPRWGQATVCLAAGLSMIAMTLAGVAFRSAKGRSFAERKTTNSNLAEFPSRIRWDSAVVSALAAALAGVAFVALSRFSDQLTVATLWAVTAKWSSLLFGLAAGVFFCSKTKADWRAVVGVSTAAVLALSLGAFPLAVRVCLDWNSSVESPALQVAARCGLELLLFAPLGVWLASWCRATRWAHQPLGFAASVGGFAVGSLWSLSLGLVLCGVPTLLLLASGGCVALSLGLVASQIRNRAGIAGERKVVFVERAVVAVALGVLVAVPFAAGQYRPEFAAKLLFDTRVFVAHRMESRIDILPHLDEGRCLAVSETNVGTLTQWRHRGRQLQLRQSGLLTATQSLDTGACPQSASDALQAILPLVLHERPNHVAILGARSGLAVETALHFPIQTVTCIESDSPLLAILQRDVWPQLKSNPATDERLELVTAEPTLALASQPGAYDLIISNADQAVLFREAAAYTSDFYQLAAHSLAPGGLFCQRFAVADVGRSTVKLMLHSWQSVFDEVAAIETSPGEWLLLGTNAIAEDSETLSHAPIVRDVPKSNCLRPGLVDRLQREHVRHALATIGWDWASPLSLNTLTQDRLDDVASDELRIINSASNGRLTAWLPWDVLRWGNKLGEINAAYGPFTRALGARLGAEAQTEEVTRRLTELSLQKQIVLDHPDEFWAYRKSIKKRLTESPHSHILQVKGQRPTKELHPNEKRRLSYFETLGAAAKSTLPSMQQLQNIEAFVEPHDPLMSFFVHQEVAELASKSSAANSSGNTHDSATLNEIVALEWRHRLYGINFSEPNDRSVRNVVSAIELLVRHPDLIQDQAERGDQLDALVQVLHHRWYARGDISPSSSNVMLNDIEYSIAAVDRALTSLDELQAARQMTDGDWLARKSAIEKSIVKPLRNYRSMMATHHARDEQRRLNR